MLLSLVRFVLLLQLFGQVIYALPILRGLLLLLLQLTRQLIKTLPIRLIRLLRVLLGRLLTRVVL
ncbi:Uncharacterised protein [Mycobacteroides abscessus subsp. abscessus]|nr:Uncharacterised protein [Mycobacteroides abscessus subsp. abscessus]SIM17728.1 Uncharacterised protein [Mycobacteroides abscessus subsp. abscessus]